MKNKLILGTAQLGNKYGFFSRKKNNFKSSKELLDYAYKNKIYELDTSSLYKNSEKIIGKFKKKKNKIITKISCKIFINSREKILQIFLQEIKRSKKKLNIKRKPLYMLLLTNVEIMFGKLGYDIYQCLIYLKKKNIILKFGFSIYCFKTIEKLIKNFKPDIIQLPYNIFDRRLENKVIIKVLNNNNVEVHIRSVFLQGILINKFKIFPKKFFKWRKHLLSWYKWIEVNNLSFIHACLSFVSNKKFVKKIIIGANDKKELEKIVKISRLKKIYVPKKFKINDTKLIDPRKW